MSEHDYGHRVKRSTGERGPRLGEARLEIDLLRIDDRRRSSAQGPHGRLETGRRQQRLQQCDAPRVVVAVHGVDQHQAPDVRGELARVELDEETAVGVAREYVW